ncbi:TRAM domain-containing protein [Eubacteriales bacterium OttesenSCG-928-N14]|nr:TRAM domain-containing protein [Eubacteriales bacterium OttesenSCG-928-N14]
MARRLLRLLVALLGGAVAAGLVFLLASLLETIGIFYFFTDLSDTMQIIVFSVAVLVGTLFTYLLSNRIISFTIRMLQSMEKHLSALPITDILAGVVGLIIGLIIALLLSNLINLIPIPFVAGIVSILSYIILIYLGITVAVGRKSDILSLRKEFTDSVDEDGEPVSKRSRSRGGIPPKILDTSVIIDGRIYDIAKTGILECKLIVPGFVLEELRHIADSADSLRRQRGRRGLDILNAMQQELDSVVVVEKNYDKLEVDDKLIRLTKENKGKLLTNDFNLNKVSQVKGVEVININQLANALKPAVMPGEEMQIQIVRDGKEHGQGVGYLDDGTMIVVDGGRAHIGQVKDIYITSVLQTAGGRMIFAKLKEAS